MINETYKDKEILKPIKEILGEQGSIQLQEFLTIEGCESLKNKEFKRKYKPEEYSFKSISLKNKKLKEEIKRLLKDLELKELKLISSNFFQFGHKDYTLLNDKKNEKEGITLFIELTKNWKEESRGYTSFIENNTEVLRIIPKENSVTIIKTNEKMKSFIKYINNQTEENKREFIELKYKSL